MSNRFIVWGTVLFMLGMMTCHVEPSLAQEDAAELKAQIQALQKRVEELESSQEEPKEEAAPMGLFPGRRGGWDPFREMDRMQEEMDRMFQHSFSSQGSGGPGVFSSTMSFNTDMDVRETKEGYEITIDMTGLDKDKVDIQINQHSITVKGEQRQENVQNNPNQYLESKSYGSFMKTIPLPVDADTANVKTEKKGDTLVIKLPKKKS